MNDQPAMQPPKRFPGGRGIITALAAFIGLAVLVLLLREQRQPEPATARVAASPSPTPAVISAPAPVPIPIAESGTPAPAARHPAGPALRILPASNAFTTLEDYRQRRASMPRVPEPVVPPPAGRTPETELGRVTFLVRDFRAAYGSNPVGTNKEITRSLLGNNPRGVKFLDPATLSLNDQGEMLDAWGRPYFFHALSGSLMEIRSAGPDGKIFTPDDLVR